MWRGKEKAEKKVVKIFSSDSARATSNGGRKEKSRFFIKEICIFGK